MFTAALFIIAKTWKQPKCPSPDDWLKKMHTPTQPPTEILLSIKKNEIMSLRATGVDLEMTILSEVSQTERNTHDGTSLISGI